MKYKPDRRRILIQFAVILTSAVITVLFSGCAGILAGERRAAHAGAEAAAPREEKVGRWGLAVHSRELEPVNPTGIGREGTGGFIRRGEPLFIRTAVTAGPARYLFCAAPAVGEDPAEGESAAAGWIEETDAALLPLYAFLLPKEGPIVLTSGPFSGAEPAGFIRRESFVQIDEIRNFPYEEDPPGSYACHGVFEDGREGWFSSTDVESFDFFYGRIVRLTEGFAFQFPGSSRRTVESVYGPPEEKESEEVQNIHDPQVMDTVHFYYYPGMTLRFYEAEAAGSEYVTDIIITGTGYSLPWDLGIGAPSGRVNTVLGPPHYIHDSTVLYTNTYYDRGNPPKGLFFTMRDGQITEIALRLEPNLGR